MGAAAFQSEQGCIINRRLVNLAGMLGDELSDLSTPEENCIGLAE
jgi:hypothetical protein